MPAPGCPRTWPGPRARARDASTVAGWTWPPGHPEPHGVATVLIPVPALDFDPTEVAVSWEVLVRLGHRVRFATPDGRPARGDDLMVTGRGLDPWGFVPGLDGVVGVGRVLRADPRGRAAYAELL